MTAVVDYKAGNLTSVKNAFETIGAEVAITSDPRTIAEADKVVFPGVGAAGCAMENLRRLGLAKIVRNSAVSGRPFLGICLGMQLLFDRSEEDGGVDGFGVFRGRVRKFPDSAGDKIPHIGWNEDYYYVHSYYADIVPETSRVCEYAGVRFTAMAKRGRLWACQFHPEKSGRLGLKLLEEWLLC